MSEKQKMNIDAIEQALKSGLSTSVYEIYIPSLERKIPFKPLLTGQCKTMAKIMIEANEKPFDTFKAVVAMIKTTCMDDTVDMNNLTELDRIKIMLEFYMNNNILKDFDIDCPDCGTKNRIKIDLNRIVEEMDTIPNEKTVFSNKQANELICDIEIPTLSIMYSYYEKLQDKEIEDDDIVNCFISNLKIVFENKELEPIEFNINEFDDIKEYFDSIKLIPYNITIDESIEKSLFEVIMDKLEEYLNIDDQIQNCSKCGIDLGGVASARNFI